MGAKHGWKLDAEAVVVDKSRGRLIFIFITIMLDCIGIGIIIPALPDVMRRFVSNESLVAAYFGYFISIYALLQFLSSPFLGALSDRYGRRPILLLSLIGAALDYVLMAFAPNLWILFIGRMISGLTGANMTVATAYIADISDDKNRAANFGLIGAAFGIGFILGPALGGVLGAHNVHYPFLAAALFNGLNFLFGLFILPESLPAEKRRTHIPTHELNPFRSFRHVFRPSPTRALVIVFVLFQLAGQVYPSTWTLYTEHKFQWTAAQVGFSLAVFGILAAISQAWLSRIILPKVGEKNAVIFGAFGLTATFILLALAHSTAQIYMVVVGSGIFWISSPALQSVITAGTPSNEQGSLQGSLNGLTSLTSIVSPIVATYLFAAFSNPAHSIYFPGAPFIYGAFMYAISCAVVLKKRSQASMMTLS